MITGGARGIGEGIGKLMLKEGAEVFLVDLKKEEADATASALREKAYGVAGDVSDPEAVERFMSDIESTAGKIDVLVNCAGIGTLSPFLNTPFELWKRGISTNLTGTFLYSQHAARVMAKKGSGAIVNIASISGSRAGTGRTVYGTTKAGIIHLTKQMAIELAAKGVRVNAVSPDPESTFLIVNYTPEQCERAANLIIKS